MRRFAARLTRITALVTVAVASALTPTSASADPGHEPVVFVHGWMGADWNWTYFVDSFGSDGWSDEDLHVWYYDWSQSNVATAEQLASEVDRVLETTGADRVDLITHSMGGLSSRHFLKFLGGTAQVDDWVSIGGPNHGTNAAYACWTTSCQEMRYGSGFLTDLNAGDETPGEVDYATLRSPCDEVINPDSSTALAGARNAQVSCIGHISLLSSDEVYESVRDFIA
ncbi:triacylglycerol lipase [Halopolyspora algeriensis]|uniref:Triacylglycerol lipase n=1 Tax=Halopolyspora algeriensis TaxID=1500506 RepID=A0A368VFN9_9ACTN|nr:triacylglycerol lipase [Halopolyspora algeriensis]RCW39970.1 triacylglycerol lipase [Halopolyspora algeriensis]TQM46593.1 triacylglycerol lipase [Halopolyspora algeriensis]